MDRMYGSYHPAEDFSDKALMSPENYPIFFPSDYPSYLLSSPADRVIPIFGSPDELLSSAGASSSVASITPTPPPPQPPPSEDNYNYSYYQAEDNNNNNYNSCYNDSNNNNNRDDEYSLIKAKIASHPSYPRLVDAYISCQKVGASPEIAGLLEEIGRENDASKREYSSSGVTCYGADPELDEFMKTYCDVLVKYKTDLERPFDEATDFLNMTQLQLRNLCTGASIRSPTDEDAVSSDEDLSGGEVDANNNQPSSEEHDLKDKLLRRFGGRISTLKLEFSKKKKKGKLPKEARQTLLEWWNVHYKWPYPTEADKIALAESTGLEQKQINNWFINQRKRHWKPSENMQFAVMNSLSGQFLDD